jgi:hypothetical protein
MSDFSPAAQAVLDAFSAETGGVYLEGDPERLAESLRAAANAVPIPSLHEEDAFHSGWWKALEQIRAIATELENAND